MKNLYAVLFFSAIITACGGLADKPAEPVRTFPADEAVEEGTVTTIQFEEFTLEISPFIVWDDEHVLDKIQSDSVALWGAVGQNLGDAAIRVIGTGQIEDLKIEQRYETTLSMATEESGCFLYDWKHYYSPWKTLPRLENGLFQCIGYSTAEEQKFPAVSTAELKAAVKKYCKKEWWDQVRDPHTYPCSVGISTYYLRVSGKTDGKPFVKYIGINHPLNC